MTNLGITKHTRQPTLSKNNRSQRLLKKASYFTIFEVKMNEQTKETTLAVANRAEKYLKDTEYLYDSGISDSERAETLPEHRQNIRDLLFVLQGVSDDREQMIDYANRRLEVQRLEIKRLEKLVEDINTMCESDAKSERGRMKHYDTAPGDKTANLQYGSTSHGAALEAEKVIRFIKQRKPS